MERQLSRQVMATDQQKVETASLIPPADGSFVYVAVKGSLHATDCAVFGLNQVERAAMQKRFVGQLSHVELINGILVNGQVLQVINSLAELGYEVVTSTGDAEITWTMKREV